MNLLKRCYIILTIVFVLIVLIGCGNDPRDKISDNFAEIYFGKQFVLVNDFPYRDPTTGAYIMSFHTYVYSDGDKTHSIVAYDYTTDNNCCLFDLYYDSQIQQEIIGGYSKMEVAYYMDGLYGTIDE